MSSSDTFSIGNTVTKKDYYEVLGVARTATPEEIKKAYRQSALKFHPDRNPDNPESEEKFKECTEAYQVLCDQEKRARYDTYGHQAPGGFGFNGNMDFGNLDDVLGDLLGGLFGGAGRRGGRRRGVDLRYDLKISFMEAFRGTEKNITVPRNVPCPTCKGSGAKPGTEPTTCSVCGGHGQVRFQQGFFSISRACHRCGGSGRIILDPCENCRGSGHVEEERKIAVKIPAGIDTGQRLRLRGEGEAGEQGGPTGDLHVVILVEDHPIFVRQGSELVIDLPLSFPQAALGDEVEVPTPDGSVKLKIPPGTQNDKVFRLRGKGMPGVDGPGRGDLHVRVFIEVPNRLSDEQTELLKKFSDLSGEDIMPQARSFWQKVRGLFEA